MAIFPQLNTGAVMQYPATMATALPVRVARFLDGSDQRWLAGPKPLRQWLVQLRDVTESELVAIQQFFQSQQGDYSPFVFPDPFSGAPVPNCRFRDPHLISSYLATDIGASSFWVVESNG